MVWSLALFAIVSSMPPTRRFLVLPARPAATSIIRHVFTSGSNPVVMLLAPCAAQFFKHTLTSIVTFDFVLLNFSPLQGFP